MKYWPEIGKCGFLVWRYLLRRDDVEPAPWTSEGMERSKKLGLSVQVRIRTLWVVFILSSSKWIPEIEISEIKAPFFFLYFTVAGFNAKTHYRLSADWKNPVIVTQQKERWMKLPALAVNYFACMDWKIKSWNPVLWSLGWKEFLQVTIVIAKSWEIKKPVHFYVFFSPCDWGVCTDSVFWAQK